MLKNLGNPRLAARPCKWPPFADSQAKVDVRGRARRWRKLSRPLAAVTPATFINLNGAACPVREGNVVASNQTLSPAGTASVQGFLDDL